MSNYTYTKHYWEDKPSSNTPITAEKLNEMEEGIYNANENKVDKEDGKGLSTNDLTNDLITDIAASKKSAHTHSNKQTLDGITNTTVDKWNTVTDKVDKVAGKGLSENDFTSALKSDYDKAVQDSHTHSNKTVIDNFSESGGQLLYSGESISGKTEIDDTQSSTETTYSSSKIEELIEAGGGGGGTPNALTKEVVTELPSYENAKDNVLYLIEDTTTPVPAEELIDDENVSSTTTYSSQKITDLLDNKVDDTNFTAHTTNNDIHVTADKKTSWDNAVTNSHIHNNKLVLDKFSEDSDGNPLYDGISIGGGSSVDSYTKSETDNLLLNKVDKVSGKGLSTNDLTNALKSNYDSAYNNSHTHTNKTVLDGITAEKVSNWDNASSSSGGGMSCELLWTNPSPKSSFPGQDILPNLFNRENYDFILITFTKNSSSLLHYANLIIPIDTNYFNASSTSSKYNYAACTIPDWSSYSKFSFYQRAVSIFGTYINITDGFKLNYNINTEYDNSVLIPYKIYGFKL